MLAQSALERPGPDHGALDRLASSAEQRQRLEQRLDALPLDEMAEEGDASPAEAVGRSRRHTVQPGAHRDDVGRCCILRELVAPASAVPGRLGKLDPRVDTLAAQAVDPVVDTRRRGPFAEPVRHEVHRPQHHVLCPAPSSRDEPARGREWVESEPCIDRRGDKRDERVEEERERRPHRQTDRALVDSLAGRVLGDHVSGPVLRRQRMRDRHDSCAPTDEVVPKRLRRAVGKTVGHDRSLIPHVGGAPSGRRTRRRRTHCAGRTEQPRSTAASSND